MIHFNSIHFKWCLKETRFPIPNYITIEVNNSSMIRRELWQTGADSTHEVHNISSIDLLDLFAKFCKHIHFAQFPHLLPTKWQRSKLSYFLSYFCAEEKKFPASSELIHEFSSMSSRLLTIQDSLVNWWFKSNSIIFVLNDNSILTQFLSNK